jgi:toxin FitB
MNLVDSCGWLEYFADGPNANFFAPPIEDVEHLIVPSICILEVFKRVLQQRTEIEAIQAISLMQQAKIIDLDVVLAINAAQIGFDLKLPLADSVILATAHAHNALLWTQDADLKDIEGVKFIPKSKTR